MSNNQAPEKRSHGDGLTLDIHSMFLTIQGEGPFAGERAFFIRLAGCNLQCPGCDTDYTSNRRRWNTGAIVSMAREKLAPGLLNLVVITGGEPFRQRIWPLVSLLIHNGYHVQIETNGTLPPGDPAEFYNACSQADVSIVCSPKTGTVHTDIVRMLQLSQRGAYKYVLKEGEVDVADGLPLRALEHPSSPCVAKPSPGVPVYVQPMDENEKGYQVDNLHGKPRNRLNLEAAMASCIKHGHRLGIQMHKIIGVE